MYVKIHESLEINSDSAVYEMVDFIKPTGFRVVPILSDRVCGETVPLAEFYVVQFMDKQKISPFLKKVPLVCEGFDHLKRVDKMGRVLLQPVTDSLSDKHLMILQELELSESNVQVVKVPASKPFTRRQFEWAKEYWPTSFHPDQDLENLLNDNFLTSEEKISVYRWSEIASEVGCVVVQNGHELVRGSRTEQLLGHPVINIVQKLAKCPRSNDDYLATGCDVYLKNEPCAMLWSIVGHPEFSTAEIRRTEYSHQVNGSFTLNLPSIIITTALPKTVIVTSRATWGSSDGCHRRPYCPVHSAGLQVLINVRQFAR
ncbi:unnamed protein product [Haemonchus placei]|uniref:CMP/dCMP-type deaminase domain-containing protein n=1 Tax=Haemonchus placei TaxID=6290 RepID=A0A0N4WRJ2_HAEPC|nr:unnamed protein product [Haemonchus placei]